MTNSKNELTLDWYMVAGLLTGILIGHFWRHEPWSATMQTLLGVTIGFCAGQLAQLIWHTFQESQQFVYENPS